MKAWWRSLSASEQRTLSIGAVVGGMLGFYALVWSPLQTHLRDLKNTALAQQRLAQWMQQTHANLQHASKQSQQRRQLNTEAMLSEIASRLEAADLRTNLSSLTQTNAQQVQCRFDAVPFDKGINWVSTMIQQYPLQVEELNVQRTPNAGVVAFTVELRLRK